MLLRVKTGCTTCRLRRVKCGEERPECLRCKKTARKCDGYSDNPKPISRSKRDLFRCHPTSSRCGNLVALAPSVNASTFENATEVQCFDFLRSTTVPQMSALVEGDFWSRLTLQVGMVEPAVTQSLLALGYLHRDYGSNDSPNTACNASYSKAVTLTRSLINRASIDETALVMLLVTMILLHFVDVGRGHYETASIHLNSGLKMIYGDVQRIQSTRDSAVADLVAAFHRVEFHSMTFSGLAVHLERPFYHPAAPDGISMPERFATLAEAREKSFALAKWISAIREASLTTSSNELYIERHHCQARLRQWKFLFDTLCEELQHDPKTSPHALVLLDIFHTTNVLALLNLPCDPEIAWDACEADFERMANQISTIPRTFLRGNTTFNVPSFSLEMGVVHSAFLAATKCRNPTLRRRFISLLKADRRREGIWDSVAAAMIAERVMEIEESMGTAGQTVKTAKDIPEHQRIKQIETDARVAQRELHMTFMRQRNPGAEWLMTKELIHF